ncbi:hypothetical protein ACTHPF_20460 [Paenibacillus sp. SAF-054]|uniref:hypothetical protein n=1 Tax=unclassified Paenibacillus TaxID=185978 RepID=UPI003F801EE1
MTKRERIARISCAVQTARSLEQKQEHIVELLTELAEGTRYEGDVKEALDALERHKEAVRSGRNW